MKTDDQLIDRMQHVLKLVDAELKKIRSKYGPFASAHEAHSVMEEEYEELWEHVKKDTGSSREALSEAIQVAAVALRYATDICGEEVLNDILAEQYGEQDIHGYKVIYNPDERVYYCSVLKLSDQTVQGITNKIWAHASIMHPFATKRQREEKVMEAVSSSVEPMPQDAIDESERLEKAFRAFMEQWTNGSPSATTGSAKSRSKTKTS